MPDIGSIDLGALTLAAVLTLTGAASAAALIVGIVSALKWRNAVPFVAGNEPRLVLLLSALLVLAAAASAAQGGQTVTLEFAFSCLVAWWAITRLAMSLYDDLTNAPTSLRAQV